MLWSDYVDAVDSHLAVEANRRGLEAFRARYIRNAVLDLQRYIRGYREANKTVFDAASVTTEGQAQLCVLPQGAKPKALWMYSVDPDDNSLCDRYRLEFYPWNKRQDLICGALDYFTWWGCCWPVGNCPPAPVTCSDVRNWQRKAYVYTMSPMGRNFLIYPQITDSTRLMLVWDGYKYTFADSDDVPYPAESSEAVASYILWRISLVIDKDINLARVHQQEYERKRLSLFRDFQETQVLMEDEKDEEYMATSFTPTGANTLQSGSVDLDSGDNSKAVVFPSPYSDAPIVDCWVVAPDGTGFGIEAWPDSGTITATGFTGNLGATIPGTGYKLYWRASPAT